MTINSISTKKFKNFLANSFTNNLLYETIDNYPSYVILSKTSQWDNESVPDDTSFTTNEIVKLKKEIIAGKLITKNNIRFLIRKIQWQHNTVYDMYDDSDKNLFDKHFFVLNSNNDVYKCLSNNKDNNSTIEPSIISQYPFKTSDDYIWKYMFSVNSSDLNTFILNDYVPFSPNTTIQETSSRTIDYIKIENNGGGYIGYVPIASISSPISNTIFKINSNIVNLSTIRGFYNLYDAYVISGTGVGQISTISDYIANSSGNYIYISSPFNNPPLDITSNISINPSVKVEGDGNNFVATATVNTISGLYYIDNINIYQKGTPFNLATATISTPSSSNNNAILRPIISPENGHGHDPINELYSDRFAISVSFSNNENNTIPVNIDYRQTALTTYFEKNKTLSEYINFNSSNGISNTYNTILIENANSYFSVGDNILYKTDTGNTSISALTNNHNYFVSFVNSSALNLSETINSNNIPLISSSISETGHKLYTNSIFSGTTFNGLNNIGVQNLTNNFIITETIRGKTSNSYGILATTNNNSNNIQTNLHISYIVGNGFSNGEMIEGLTSNNTAIINSIINSDIKNFSTNNQILAISNFTKITHTSNTSEQILFTFNN